MCKDIKEQIEIELHVLIKQKLYDIGRAGSLLWVSFGEEVITLDGKGLEKLKGKYTLHIQCTWRITTDDEIIVASGDIFQPRTGLSYEDFEWDTKGENRFDEKIPALKKEFQLTGIINYISADKYGGLRICFDSGICLEVFPDDSLENEFWRFIKFEDVNKHFVVFDKE